MSNQTFSIYCPANNYGQTSLTWNACRIVNVTVDNDDLKDGDQLFFDSSKNLWVTEQRNAHVSIIPDNSNMTSFVRYNPISDQLSYKPIHYGMFGFTGTENISTEGTDIKLNYSSVANGITHDSNNIIFSQNGIYKIGISILFSQTSGSSGKVLFVFKKNNNIILNSGTETIVHGNDVSSPVHVEIFESIDVNDKITVTCINKSSHVIRYTSITESENIICPAIILTVQQIV